MVKFFFLYMIWEYFKEMSNYAKKYVIEIYRGRRGDRRIVGRWSSFRGFFSLRVRYGRVY